MNCSVDTPVLLVHWLLGGICQRKALGCCSKNKKIVKGYKMNVVWVFFYRELGKVVLSLPCADNYGPRTIHQEAEVAGAGENKKR